VTSRKKWSIVLDYKKSTWDITVRPSIKGECIRRVRWGVLNLELAYWFYVCLHQYQAVLVYPHFLTYKLFIVPPATWQGIFRLLWKPFQYLEAIMSTSWTVVMVTKLLTTAMGGHSQHFNRSCAFLFPGSPIWKQKKRGEAPAVFCQKRNITDRGKFIQFGKTKPTIIEWFLRYSCFYWSRPVKHHVS